MEKPSYEVPPIFGLIQKRGSINERVMYNTFNMGIGLVISLAEEFKEQSLEILKSLGEEVYEIGRVKNIENAG